MLALPMAIADGGYYRSIFLFFSTWLITVLVAFYILEANLWLPENTHFISIAKITLGKGDQVITWILAIYYYLYTLLAAYISGSNDLVHNLLLSLINITTPEWLASILFVVILGTVYFYGILAVDWMNRGLMSTKLVVYFLLVLFISPHVDFGKLSGGQLLLLSNTVMVIITSLSNAVFTHANSELVKRLIHFFTSICIATSFLSVSLCLSDFMIDRLKIKKIKNSHWMLVAFKKFSSTTFNYSFLPSSFYYQLKLRRHSVRYFADLITRLNGLERPLCEKNRVGYEVIGGKTFIIIRNPHRSGCTDLCTLASVVLFSL